MRKLFLILFVIFTSTNAIAEQNTAPIYSKVPRIGFATLTGNIASTRSDGVGTIGVDMKPAITADSVDGTFVSKMRITPAATTSTSMTASVIRIFISSSSATSGALTADNNVLFQEIAVAALAAAHTSNANNYYEVVFNIVLPPSYTIFVSTDDNVAANTRWQIETFGGDY